MPLVSVIIASMNRPAALRSIVTRLLDISQGLPVDVVVADASPKDHQLVLEDPRLTIVHLESPGGVDADYDRAVRGASGTYCWFFTDDDAVDDDAVASVVTALSGNNSETTSLLLVDARVVDPKGNLLQKSLLPSATARSFPPGTGVEAFAPFAPLLTFIGSVVIDRSLWMSRVSDDFVGSEFRHVGLILSAPLPGRVLVLERPRVTITYGLAHWETRALEVWTKKWPMLIRSCVERPDAWGLFYPESVVRQASFLVDYRARGLLSHQNVQLCFPFERSAIRSMTHATVARLPRSVARVLSRIKAKRQSPESRMLQFDLSRS